MSDRPQTSSPPATAPPRWQPPRELVEKLFAAQQELTTRSFAMEQAASGSLMLKSLLLEVVSVANQLTGAEESSLFLLDTDGTVKESILARGATIKGQRNSLIGQVLDRGLAGWVTQYRQIGVISDTQTDDRWIKLPSEPYKVRSALCVPIQKGKHLLGLVTLMHAEPESFGDAATWCMEQIAPHLALVLDRAVLYANQNATPLPQVEAEVPEEETSVPDRESLSSLGQYIITVDSKFLYANHRFAEIFEYSFEELVGLGSLLKLVVDDDYDRVNKGIHECFQQDSSVLELTFKCRQKYGYIVEVELAGNRTKFYGKFAIIGTLRSVQSL